MPAVATAPTRAAPTVGWDSRLFALRGDDRGHLRERTATLAAFARRHPDRFAELAATLADDDAPGVRLAVVATSAEDLAAKLTKAADRLADARVRSLRDAGGVYFTADPLYQPGSLALLFPGEGAQYPGMLADLCGVFPEVEDTFAWADALAADAGRPSLRTVLHPPPGSTPEPTTLGPAIFGVLLADQAVFRVLERLRLPVGAVAGHSAGEIAALLAAGAMPSDGLLGPALVGLMDLMDRQEHEGGGPDCALLAVGAGTAAVLAVAEAVAPGEVLAAMDNCPHQCVAVGPAAAVAAVEKALAAKGLLCERLPVNRPYHTPLFEPWMGPFRDLFAGITFGPPRVPAYCCSTGGRFPIDPAAVRELAVEQWVRPVEFTRMIERMHADGVRLFVEAGPRATLSGFVEDVLRGKPAVAVAANPHRLSGPTGVNRLAAQLLVHQVPLDAGGLFADVGGRVEWEATGFTPSPPVLGERVGVRGRATAGASVSQRHAVTPSPQPSPPGLGERGPEVAGGPAVSDPVVLAHLAAMEQFLDVQQAVMAAFLQAEPAPPPEPEKPFAFVGSIEALAPGRSITFRRPLDLREDLFSNDHTLGGREVSRVDPAQRGLPVLPMTASLEAMAEAALLLAPGKVVVGIRDVRLRRWIPYDRSPTTLEVRAERIGEDEVRADVRDLGNSFVPDGANKTAAEAVVLLADRYPDPPAPRPFDTSDAKPCRITIDILRTNMFHGPLYQMIDGLGDSGPHGIEGTLTVAPRSGWLASNPDPRVVLDPILTDAAMHLIGAWHTEQPDWTGRILLPFELNRLEVFGPPPEPGTRLLLRGHTEQESARHFRHGLEVFMPDGRPWLRLTGAGYWRFYLPFSHVNFYGPKDEYFLSRDWPEAAAAGGCCYAIRPPADLMQPVLRMSGAKVTMTPREVEAFEAVLENEKTDWLFTRLLAKDAARAAWHARHGEWLFPADIETHPVNGRLVASFRGTAGPEPLPAVAVVSRNGLVAGYAAFVSRVGIGIAATAEEAAHLAVADAGGDAAGRYEVATARDGDLFVATTRLDPK